MAVYSLNRCYHYGFLSRSPILEVVTPTYIQPYVLLAHSCHYLSFKSFLSRYFKSSAS
nr:MAG TPA: hypothetical protein [Caudoviricetes sp.]DAU13591.1 MAG TPA: hypothetical protein [Caudoviricetes sp.]